MKQIFRREVMIGLLVILALVLLYFGINFLKGVNIFKAANYYYASYNNVEGLAVSAPVTLNGYKIGLVRSISYDYNRPGNVIVEMSVDKSLRLPKGSTASLGSDLLGTASISLKLGNPAEGMYAIGDTIPGQLNAGMMAALSENLLPAVNAIVPKVDTLLTSLNTLVADPALATSLKRLDGITAELNATLRSLNKATSSLGPVVDNVKNITSNVDTMTGDLTAVTGRLREAPIDSIANNIQATIANLNELTAQLNNRDSSVGKLLNDPALYDNLNATVASLDSLFVDIKRNPKRYISIKVF
ncbi:MAG: MCE family protein [Muribaculaceae bacterium]|nr:MCE family protein [Muribaculaceae bacterium]